MRHSLFQVDAFTALPFAGNPAAVLLLEQGKDSQWMQQVAAEMNLSETAFLHPLKKGWKLRWYTPTVEVDLCGHATLAAAHVLFSEGIVGAEEQIEFHTLSGLLSAGQRGNWLWLNFPAEPPWPEEIDPGIITALGAKPIFVGRNRVDHMVEVASEQELLSLKPDMGALASRSQRGVIVTAKAARPGYDFVSRFFGPSVGIDEDPVTGSAHCCLGPYWRKKLNKHEFLAWQASPRGGAIKVELQGSRVLLGGQAVTVLRGEFLG